MTADRLLFEAHLQLPEYRQGEILGYWGEHRLKNVEDENGQQWPFSTFWIAAATRPDPAPERYFLKIRVDNYNVAAPAGCFWDVVKNSRLENCLWPKVTGPFSEGFKSNFSVPDQLYAPWDRGGVTSHPEWVQNFPAVAWRSGISRIDQYLAIVHEILNGENYHGVQG
ncbi:DUF7665 family protein [Dawidia soli]|uniref:Uncharacterized protein n=1 Tax=Dawidia soli TaxID=2782352 RepID=A0AAP2GHN4_9BACT|nr:hypothetical protein [Dawidia soli]MBT1686183.1 hypothetical protein [Dawidia soli]